MRASISLVAGSLALLLGVGPSLRAADNVIVHEWGTFTCLQDDRGKALTGINVDDEPVPPFVYDEGGVRVTAQYSPSKRNFGLPPYSIYTDKGWLPGDPEVTMRLETPVIYFYPPRGQAPASVPLLQVHVDFHGGILSQSYPYAQLDGLPNPIGSRIQEKGILKGMTSSLTWKDVRLGSTGKPVETEDKVWTTPREVSAPLLQVSGPNYNGSKLDRAETEQFLFYRGVGHLDSPLFLSRGPEEMNRGDRLNLWPQRFMSDYSKPALVPQALVAMNAVYPAGWLVEIRADGSCAFRAIPAFSKGTTTRMHPITTLSSKFVAADFGPGNLLTLKVSMQQALIQVGLYPDEASALLRTWELSYFKSPGLRFFYVVPRAWVDVVLPLKVTGAPTEITRVMIGRIELITEAQKAALARLAAGPCPDLAAVREAAQNELEKSTLPKDEVEAFYRGEKPLSELGIPIPPLVQDYLSLGRFRDALIVHEEQEHPGDALAQFIKENRLDSQAD